MDFFHLSILGTISGTFLTVIIYAYLYMVYRERYMGIWILSWICYFIRLVFLDSNVDMWKSDVLTIIFALITIFNAFLLAWGIHDFIGRKMRSWGIYVTIAVAIVSILIILSNRGFEIRGITVAVFFGLMYIWTGIIFLKNINTRGFGGRITGFALIILGIHGIDFVFLRLVEWFAPWGYLIDSMLRLIIAIGTLLVYFEKTRNDLVRKEEYFRLLTENAVDAIFRYQLHPKLGFEYISPSITAITGYSPEEYYTDAKLATKIVYSGDMDIFEAFWQDFLAGDASLLTVRLICKDQRQIWAEQKCMPIYSEDGHILAVEGVLRDVTVRKQLEQDILRLDRLNTVGEMAANLAHEVRNPMTTIRGYLQMLSYKKEFIQYNDHFAFMVDELDRANSIISEYLAFCKDKIVDLKLNQPNKIIESLYPLIKADGNAMGIYVKLDLADIPEIYLDEKEIRQVILNLARNGLEAMEAGGTVTMRTYLENDNVVLAVQDCGSGIPPHIIEKVGTPFFTTKDMGTGLGLAVCYRIVNRHKATMKIDTSSEGTTISIYFALPRSTEII